MPLGVKYNSVNGTNGMPACLKPEKGLRRLLINLTGLDPVALLLCV